MPRCQCHGARPWPAAASASDSDSARPRLRTQRRSSRRASLAGRVSTVAALRLGMPVAALQAEMRPRSPWHGGRRDRAVRRAESTELRKARAARTQGRDSDSDGPDGLSAQPWFQGPPAESGSGRPRPPAPGPASVTVGPAGAGAQPPEVTQCLPCLSCKCYIIGVIQHLHVCTRKVVSFLI